MASLGIILGCFRKRPAGEFHGHLRNVLSCGGEPQSSPLRKISIAREKEPEKSPHEGSLAVRCEGERKGVAVSILDIQTLHPMARTSGCVYVCTWTQTFIDPLAQKVEKPLKEW